MKTTSKILLAAFALVVMSTSAFAQNGRLSVGAELGLPMGDFGDAANMGFGGSLRYEYPMGDNLGLMLTAGYLAFGGKDIEAGGLTFKSGDWTMIPIQAGIKYYFVDNQEGFYGEVDLGVHSTKYTIPASTITYFGVSVTTPEIEVSSTDLSYAPAIGYHLDNLDFGLRYQMIATEGSTTSYLGLRVAYVFGEK